MTTVLLHALEAPARLLSTVALDAIWQDAFILLLVLLMLRAWPRLNAPTRYATWLIALVTSLAVPIATAVSTPVVATPTNSAVGPTSARVIPSNVTLSGARAHQSNGLSRSEPRQSQATARGASISARANALRSVGVTKLFHPQIALPLYAVIAIAVLWVLASLMLLCRLISGIMKLQGLKRNSLPLPIEYRDALARCNATAHGRDVRFCVSDETEVPVAIGLFDSMVLIPRHLLDSLSPAELEQICLHECGHLRRADDWTNLLQRIIVAILWFSPAVYAIARGLDLEREVACDDGVVVETGAVRPYAQCLTKMAEVTAWPHHPLAAPGVFITRRGISERIERLLRAGRSAARGLALGPTATAIAAVTMLGLAAQLVAPTLALPVSNDAAPAKSHVTPKVSREAQRTTARTLVAETSPAPTATPPTISVPSKHVYVPAKHVHIPARHIHTSGYDVNVPAVHVHVPSVNVNVPAVNVDVPPVNVDIPAMHFTVPSDVTHLRSSSCESGCDFEDVSWAGRNFRGRSYSAADFEHANLVGADFAGDTFNAVDFEGADLRHASFAGATMTYVDFENARLAGADFNGAHLSACDFDDVDMSHVDLSHAHLDSLCSMSLSNR
jgi:beta-lactamase regulating signal transducer with metallopeptidase domain